MKINLLISEDYIKIGCFNILYPVIAVKTNTII